jgi:hypothetical protein
VRIEVDDRALRRIQNHAVHTHATVARVSDTGRQAFAQSVPRRSRGV